MAKKKSSVYSVGARSPNWLKVKPIRTAEFVIVGYTKGNRGSLGALLLGYWDKGTLQYVGRVGTGFDTRTISMLLGRLQPLTTKKIHFCLTRRFARPYGSNLNWLQK
ncbi:hypothetical protein ACFS07_32515 [Undibacterium arcticum]